MKNKFLILFIILIGILAICYFSMKFLMLNKYGYDEESLKSYNEIVDSFEIKGNVTVNSVVIDDSDYYKYGDIYIRNDFLEYEETVNDDYVRFTSDNAMVSFGEHYVRYYIDIVKSDVDLVTPFGSFSNFKMIDHTDRIKYLEDNDINTDIEFFSHFEDNYLEELSLFTSNDVIKESSTMMSLVAFHIFKDSKLFIIDGDLDGLMVVTDHYKECYIYGDENTYVFSFAGDFTNEYINGILNTVVVSG